MATEVTTQQTGVPHNTLHHSQTERPVLRGLIKFSPEGDLLFSEEYIRLTVEREERERRELEERWRQMERHHEIDVDDDDDDDDDEYMHGHSRMSTMHGAIVPYDEDHAAAQMASYSQHPLDSQITSEQYDDDSTQDDNTQDAGDSDDDTQKMDVTDQTDQTLS